ncbi:phenylacetate-coenzyme A ligase [Spirochaetia bacterium]|nr:phenylacetate-coenzyme A ligase [Spirochaetia bacterium]
MIKLYSEEYIVRYARQHSPFYRALYKDVQSDRPVVQDVPLINQSDFWAANTNGSNNTVLTGAIENGVVFKSGGSTSAPKFSVFAHDEYETFCHVSGLAFMYNGAQSGDRIANLFYGGLLYTSFLYVHDFVRYCPMQLIEYPIMGSTPIPEMLYLIEQHKCNVINGVPTTIISLFEHAKKTGADISFVNKIYFGGETFFQDQRDFIHSVNSKVEIRSASYSLVDGGLVGFGDSSCGFNEHRAFDYVCRLEIVDSDTGEVINETNKTGNLVVTSLYRLLQPMIRYPLGDRGMWLEPQNVRDRKFLLQGRSEEGARVGVVSFYYDDLHAVLQSVSGVHILNYQLIITHFDGKDALTVRVATNETALANNHKKEFLLSLYKERVFFKEEYEKGHIHEPVFEFIPPDKLEYNPRTGKIKRIIDRRL